jgi:hypothetical protein
VKPLLYGARGTVVEKARGGTFRVRLAGTDCAVCCRIAHEMDRSRIYLAKGDSVMNFRKGIRLMGRPPLTAEQREQRWLTVALTVRAPRNVGPLRVELIMRATRNALAGHHTRFATATDRAWRALNPTRTKAERRPIFSFGTRIRWIIGRSTPRALPQVICSGSRYQSRASIFHRPFPK